MYNTRRPTLYSLQYRLHVVIMYKAVQQGRITRPSPGVFESWRRTCEMWRPTKLIVTYLTKSKTKKVAQTVAPVKLEVTSWRYCAIPDDGRPTDVHVHPRFCRKSFCSIRQLAELQRRLEPKSIGSVQFTLVSRLTSHL